MLIPLFGYKNEILEEAGEDGTLDFELAVKVVYREYPLIIGVTPSSIFFINEETKRYIQGESLVYLVDYMDRYDLISGIIEELPKNLEILIPALTEELGGILYNVEDEFKSLRDLASYIASKVKPLTECECAGELEYELPLDYSFEKVLEFLQYKRKVTLCKNGAIAIKINGKCLQISTTS